MEQQTPPELVVSPETAPGSRSIVASTEDYEAWLGDELELVPEDLQLKHEKMAAKPFSFLRATFYRWMELWPLLCPELNEAPKILAIGDLHIENFGTWRDIEGRLIWGVDDFDEAYELPYALDLVRLATSALLAVKDGVVNTPAETVCAQILKGYRRGMEVGARPYVLGEGCDWLRELAMEDLRDPNQFAEKMRALPKAPYPIPRKVAQALSRQMPEEGLKVRYRHRVAGLGSLGRRRIVALARWYGGIVVREAKQLAPSACVWANRGHGSQALMYDEIVERAQRCPDPFSKLSGRWIIRRLAPDSSSIEIDRLPKGKEMKLLKAMGHETANVHLGTARKAIRAHLETLSPDWLEQAAHCMAEATLADWREFKAHREAELARQPPQGAPSAAQAEAPKPATAA